MKILIVLRSYQKNMIPRGIIFCQVKEEIPKNFFSSPAEAARTGLAASALAWTRTEARRGN